MNRRSVVSVLVALAGAGWGVKQFLAPVYRACPACGGRGQVSCGAPGCDVGRVPCDGPCLKLATPGWQHLDVKGHSPDELWMRFDNGDGTYRAWNQNHVGEVIERVDGQWTNVGKCPVCQGKATKPCPVCHGTRTCARCQGLGNVRDWLAIG